MSSFKQFCQKKSAADGVLLDATQSKLIDRLAEFAQQINSERSVFGTISKLLGRRNANFHGVYIWGDVGRGKSMLLNWFYEYLETTDKQKTHFHDFMLKMHHTLDAKRKAGKKNPLKSIARDIAKHYKVLILDELQINNIADAMIVERLFAQLISLGVFVFFSSNRIPHDLFKDGLQRDRFLPFIDLVNSSLLVFHLDNFIDYRMNNLELAQSYFYPITPKNIEAVNTIVKQLTGHTELQPMVLEIADNHHFTAYKTWGHFARFSFRELCEAEVGATEYLALCRQFSVILLDGIYSLSTENHNELLRFITLIDCLYENKIKLICLADCAPEKIYNKGKHSFEFKRTLSRLNEMQSKEYFNSTIKTVEENRVAANI